MIGEEIVETPMAWLCRYFETHSYRNHLPDIQKSWDVPIAPEPDPTRDPLLRITPLCGKFLSMNILLIDEKRVIAERHHTGMLRALERWGFDPIHWDLMHCAPFGGSYHCATLDIRRRAPWNATSTECSSELRTGVSRVEKAIRQIPLACVE
ncbi:hypothetical protein [Streptomyces rubiginosohelvolus]